MGVIAFVPYFTILLLPPLKAASAVLMVFFVFYPCRIKRLLEGAAVFFAGAFMTAGIVVFFRSGAFIFAPMLIYLPAVIIKKNIKKDRRKTILVYKGKAICEEGFSDSGNMLTKDGLPVLIGTKRVFNRLFGDGFCEKAPMEWSDKRDLKVISYRTLGKSGKVFGISLDYVEVDGKRYYGAVLAYCNEEVSEDLILNSVML